MVAKLTLSPSERSQGLTRSIDFGVGLGGQEGLPEPAEILT